MKPDEIWEALYTDMHACIARKDWHGVSDAANDLRELEAQYPDLKD